MPQRDDTSAGPQRDAAVDVSPQPDEAVAPPVLAVVHRFRGIDLVASVNHARHVHGGEPAAIDHAVLSFEVRDGDPHAIAVSRIELLRAHCREQGWRDRKRLAITGHEAYTWTGYDPIATGRAGVTLPAAAPQRYGVHVTFSPVPAYQACDRFGFAVTLVVDGVRFATELPLEVKRFEPLRRNDP